jgi:hypothetical protein
VVWGVSASHKKKEGKRATRTIKRFRIKQFHYRPFPVPLCSLRRHPHLRRRDVSSVHRHDDARSRKQTDDFLFPHAADNGDVNLSPVSEASSEKLDESFMRGSGEPGNFALWFIRSSLCVSQ